MMGRSKESQDYAKQRKCNWGTVVYPTREFYIKYLSERKLIKEIRLSDGCPIDPEGKELYNGSDGWGEFGEKEYNIVLDSLVPCCISPMHYLDIDFEEDGAPYKKPHFHILFIYESVKSYDQVISFFETFKGVGAKALDSRRGAARYLCHMDHPHKAQYDKSFVVCTGGLDYYSLVNSSTDEDSEVCLMMDYIIDNHIFTFRKFLMICKSDFPNWFSILSHSRGYVIDKFIKSYCCEIENIEKLDSLEKSACEFDIRVLKK